MKISTLVNIIPPKKQLTIENITLSKHKGYNDLDVEFYSGRCLGYLIAQFQNIDPGSWEEASMDLFSKIDIENTEWTMFENSNDNITDSYIKYLSLFINKDFNLTKFNPDTAPLIRDINNRYIQLFSNGIKLCRKKSGIKIQVSFYRFFASFTRSDNLDSILDLCSAIEAIYNINNELRLKIALITGALLNCTSSMKKMYSLYSIRNDFIHGNSIPQVIDKELSEYQELVYSILHLILDKGESNKITEISSTIMDRIEFK
tara:strand:+ start:51 stop:830 length:780 start_codon:yes stop_codon:yes gene_type:complete